MKPANTTIQALSFAERVALVNAEVSQRVKKSSQNNLAALRARLWCQWIRREVLS